MAKGVNSLCSRGSISRGFSTHHLYIDENEITNLVIPESVTSIGDYAFINCTGLTELTIPNSVQTIGTYAFDGCTSLTKVNVNWDTPIGLPSSSFSSETYNNATLNLPINAVPFYVSTDWWECFKKHAAEGYAINDYSDDVFNYALVTNPENRYAILVSGDYSAMITANIPERFTDLTDEANPVRYKITAIGCNAFKNCTQLKEVNFNSRSIINNIASEAFSGCSGLTEVTIPNSVQTIGDGAFSDCSGLTKVTIGNSVQTIGIYAFSRCSGLTKAEFASIESLCSIEFKDFGSNPLYYAHHIYIDGNEITNLVIPESVTSIGDYAFINCTGLTEVTIGKSVQTIGNWAFTQCGGLTEVTIPNSVQTIGIYAFNGCRGLTEVTIPNSVQTIGDAAFSFCSGLTEVTIPNSVQTIGNWAFSFCSGLTEVTIPNSVQTIGFRAFQSCSGLTSISLLDGNEIEFGEEVFYDTNYIKDAYIGRPLTTQVLPLSNLETLTIGNTVTEIGDSLWKDAKELKSLTLGSNLKSIGDNAFSGCTALTEVIVPPAVESIGASAFAGNTALASIIMGHSVKTIGEKAYDGCPANTVSITAQTPPTAPNTTFSNYTGKLYLQGENAVNAYYNAYTCWDRFDSYVMIEPTELKYTGETTITGKPGDTVQLTATLMPENVTLPQVFWRSTNPEIATVDANGLVTIHADLNEMMTLAEDEEETSRACKIIAESLYADGPILKVTVTVTTGIEEVKNDTVNDGKIDFNAPFEVYNISGMKIAVPIENLSPGIYIVRQGKVAKKIAIK